MKRLLIAVVLFGLVLCSTSCNNPARKANSQEQSTKKKGKYICTMHPSVTADTPGLCPKCGMEMVERDTTADK